MSLGVALALGIVAFVVLLFALVMIPVRRRARSVAAALREELGDAMTRSEQVRGLGLESRGRGQVRGNGTLALTADELVFRMWVPQRETRIPLAGVIETGTQRWWLGNTNGRPLLYVRWRGADGSEDAMAWQVRDAEAWLAELPGEPSGPALAG